MIRPDRRITGLATIQIIHRPPRHLPSVVALLCIVAVANGCGQKQAASAQGPGAVPVKTVVIQPVQIPDASEYLATLKSRHSSVLNPQVEGQVTNIFVRSGGST